jgi:hypothetical protein
VIRWSILPAYLVRTAGFAFARLDALRCSASAAAVQVLGDAATARLAAGTAFDHQLGTERYADHPAFDDPEIRKALSRHVKKARAFARRSIDEPVPTESLAEVTRVVPRIGAFGAALADAHARWREAEQTFAAIFAADLERSRAALRALYRDDRLQEAVFLESPEAFERIRQLVASEGARDARARQRERLAAMYAQRFCAKNDTNSICGPHGLAFVTPGDTCSVEIGGDLRRATYFSHWAAQRLLDEAVRRAGDDARTTLRLHPSARVDETGVAWCVMDHDATSTFRRRHARSELPPAGVQLLRALATPHTHDELGALAPDLGLEVEELAPFLDELAAAGVIIRGPLVPPGLFHPLRAVAAELASWPASDAQRWALAETAAFEQLVAEFATAPLSNRIDAVARIGARFVAATATAASRGDGRHYADRALLHEDCCVAVRSQLGATGATLETSLPALIAAVELPLELARERVREWFRARFGAGPVAAVVAHRAFDEDRVLETAAATPRADLLRVAIGRVRDVLERAASRGVAGVARLSSAELRGALADVLEPAHAGYVSADLLLRRLPSGASELVLGELHGFCFLPTCLLDVLPDDDRARVLDQMRAAVRELAGGRTTAECVFLHTQATDRRFPIGETDLQLIVPSERADALDLGFLDMRLVGDDFEFWHGDREIVPVVAYTRYPFLLYTSRVAPLFDDFAERFFPDSLLPAVLRDHDAPRFVIDDLVFRRRSWRRSAAAVRAALAASSEVELFRRAQDLRREIGCDARVFVSLTGEPKPILVDFENVFLLEALANVMQSKRDEDVVRISEMLPDPNELVALGPDGSRTSELRIGFYRLPTPCALH